MEYASTSSDLRVIAANYETGGYALRTYGDSSTTGKDKNAFSVYIDGKGYNNIISNNSYAKDKKYSLSGSYDGNILKLWENNNKYTKSISGKIKNTNNSTIMALGANPSKSTAEGEYTPMKVYSVRIYSRALTDEEIQQNYAIDKTRFGVE